MAELWRSSGYRLLARRPDGRLAVTDDFLRAYLRRPELAPEADADAAELALHRALLDDPRRPVAAATLVALTDSDARDNYAVLLRLREVLLAAPTVEDAYLALTSGAAGPMPPLFADQLAHAILRGLLDRCDDPLRLRAAELLFRSQKVNLAEGAVLCADEETVARTARPPAHSVDLDLLTEANASAYRARSDRFDFALDIGFTRPGLDALCRVLEDWVRHFRSVDVAIQPVQSVHDERWSWHVGLDAEASALLNDLYDGQPVDDARRARLLALFRLDVLDEAAMLPRVAGKPVYLGLAMTAANVLRLKPQNLLANLPLRTS